MDKRRGFSGSAFFFGIGPFHNKSQDNGTGLAEPSGLNGYSRQAATMTAPTSVLAGTETEVAGEENVVGGVFSSSIQVTAVDIVVHSLGFLNQRLLNVYTGAGDVTLPINQRLDRQYENP